MNESSNRTCIVMSILALTLMGAACAQSSSPPEESDPPGDAAAVASTAAEPEPSFVTVNVSAGTAGHDQNGARAHWLFLVAARRRFAGGASTTSS